MSERTFSSAAAVFIGAVALGSLASTVHAQEGGSAAVAVATSGEYGAHLTDAQGKTLYMFTADKQGKGDAKAVSNCYDQCAQAWPPLLTQGIKVDLPKAGAEPLPEELLRDHQPLVLSVDRDGRYYLNIGSKEESPIDADTVVERVAVVLKRQPQTPVLVKADRSVPYGDVVNGMVLLQEAGAEKVGFITDPAETRDRSKR